MPNQFRGREDQVLRHQQHFDDYLTYVGLNCTEATVDSYRTKLRPKHQTRKRMLRR